MTNTNAKDIVAGAIGRIISLGSRPFQDGDLEEYDRCKAVVMNIAQIQREKVSILRHLVSQREEQVNRHGDLFADELASAQRELARCEAGEFAIPRTAVALDAHRSALKAAQLKGF